MSRKAFNGLPRVAIGLIAAICLTFAAVSAAVGASPRKVPAKDSFRGRVTAGTGAFHGAHGLVALYLHIRRSGGARHRLTLDILRRRCPRAASHCVVLSGTVTGTLTKKPPSQPDTGERFTIHASGRVKPTGDTSVTGSGLGTGYVVRGRESMQITFSSSRGQVTVHAHSAKVGGFTSP